MKTETVGGPGQKKRVDPHHWEKRRASLVFLNGVKVSGILRENIEINLCITCGLWTEEHPQYIHDLPPCTS